MKKNNRGLWFLFPFLLLATVSLAGPQPSLAQVNATSPYEKFVAYDQILMDYFNHFNAIEANREAKKKAEQLIAQYPDEPYFYELWAGIEWTLLGHELNLKMNEQKDITLIPEYQDRVKKYEELTTGIASKLKISEQNTKNLTAQAAIRFERSKFMVKFTGGLNRFTNADEESGLGVRYLKLILKNLPDFCPAYFFLGAMRQVLISNSEAWSIKRAVMRWGSKTSEELKDVPIIQEDVFDEEETLRWLEKAFSCGYQEWWFKKSWIESGFVLIDAYGKYRQRKDIHQDLVILENKEIPLLEKMSSLFPDNKDLSKKLVERQVRRTSIKNYLASQK